MLIRPAWRALDLLCMQAPWTVQILSISCSCLLLKSVSKGEMDLVLNAGKHCQLASSKVGIHCVRLYQLSDGALEK